MTASAWDVAGAVVWTPLAAAYWIGFMADNLTGEADRNGNECLGLALLLSAPAAYCLCKVFVR